MQRNPELNRPWTAPLQPARPLSIQLSLSHPWERNLTEPQQNLQQVRGHTELATARSLEDYDFKSHLKAAKQQLHIPAHPARLQGSSSCAPVGQSTPTPQPNTAPGTPRVHENQTCPGSSCLIQPSSCLPGDCRDLPGASTAKSYQDC